MRDIANAFSNNLLKSFLLMKYLGVNKSIFTFENLAEYELQPTSTQSKVLEDFFFFMVKIVW